MEYRGGTETPWTPVVIVGAGPDGLTAALELARHGVASTVIEARSGPSHTSSRTILAAGHTLDTWAKLGAADPILDHALPLTGCRTYFRDVEIGHTVFAQEERPRLVSISQDQIEDALLAAVDRSWLIEVRFGCAVTGITDFKTGVRVNTKDGSIEAAYALGCDGEDSTVRQQLGLPFPGRVCHDLVLAADIRANLQFSNERLVWCDAPSNPGRQILLYPQPGGKWSIQWQMPAATDRRAEEQSGRLDRRIRELIGNEPYERTRLRSYRVRRGLVPRFRSGRVFLAGDAAHLMSPCDAGGMNSGVEDVVNLAWKLALVLRAHAPDVLLNTYNRERRGVARSNLRSSMRSASCTAPPSPMHRAFRAAVLRACVRSQRARRWANAVRVTQPAEYARGRHRLVGRPLPRALDHVVPGQMTVLVRPRWDLTWLEPEVRLLPVRLAHLSVADQADSTVQVPKTSAIVVRPDGYVAAVVPYSTGAIRRAVLAALKRPMCD